MGLPAVLPAANVFSRYCGGRVKLVVAEATVPADPAGFERHDSDGLTVCAEPGLGGPLSIGLDWLLGLASLYVEGTVAQM